MAVGMAIGTRFYLLGVAAAVVISLVILLMTRFDWYARDMSTHILRIQTSSGAPPDAQFEGILSKYTNRAELISVDSVQGGAMTDLTYSVGMKKASQVQDFVTEIRDLNGSNRISLIAGYNGTDL
jgi:uncharacterized membrane protein YhiD involved in acid resistance